MSRSALWLAATLGTAPPRARLAALADAPILLTISPDAAATRGGQVMLATAANVIGRLFDFAPAIDVEAGSARALERVVGLRAGVPLASEVVAALAARTVTPGRFRYRRAASGSGPYAAALAIGGGTVPAGVRDAVYVDAAGWTARVSRVPARASGGVQPGGFNPFGPLVAAALGAAELTKGIFRRLAGDTRAAAFPALAETVTWDLWGHALSAAPLRAAAGRERPAMNGAPPLAPGLDLGRVAVAGLGALGSAAVWALAHLDDASGTLELVDDDRLSPSNLERVLTAQAADVDLTKVRVAGRLLRGGPFRTVEIADRYGVTAPARARATTVLVGVDSGAARRQIMNLLPRAVYNGGTQAGEVLVSRHVGLEGPCLECLYPETERGMPARAEPCGGGVFIEELPEPTIGFVSALGGFLMACELVKDRIAAARSTPLDAVQAALRVDLLAGALGPDCIETLVPRRDCFCRDPATQRRFGDRYRG